MFAALAENGRVIPAELLGGEMASTSNRNVMRLLLLNQSVFAKIFTAYSVRASVL